MSRPAHQSSEQILHSSLASSARIARRAKKILEDQLRAIETELNRPDVLPVRRGELLRMVLEVSAELHRQTEALGRLIVAKPAPGSADGSPTLSPQEIMAEIISGKAKKSSGQR
jgi:hypothetical protein